jgi:predicted 3-demethylubiquinone-9 3-methyltransferase (glyoxalase superfamily)
MMQKITPYLWFDGNLEEAIHFYVSVFPNSRILNISKFDGGVVMGTFELEGQTFMALQGGPMFKFTEAFSLFVDCATQAEVDTLWDKLTADGGSPSRCGWLKDKYGLSWQIIPKALMQLMSDPNPAKSGAVMQAMLKMDKIVIAELQAAYDGV